MSIRARALLVEYPELQGLDTSVWTVQVTTGLHDCHGGLSDGNHR